jgi:hypothetical protein
MITVMSYRRFLVLPAVLPPILAASLLITFQTETSWVDPFSGSTKRETIRFWGLSRTTEIEPTALEAWLRRRQLEFSHRWQYVHATEYNVWGRPLLFACGHAPPLYGTRSVLDRAVAQATDDELVRLTELLEQGDESRIEAALDGMFDRTLARFAADGRP